MSNLKEFTIIPTLGLKTDVAQDDNSLFKSLSSDGSVAMTHDTGGVNVDYGRTRNAAVKSKGYIQWSNSANYKATRCLGLFYLNDGTNKNYLEADGGKIFVFDSNYDPGVMNDAAATTFATTQNYLYSFVQVGEYAVFSDRGAHCPYKWKHADATLSKLEQGGGVEYTFRYLEVFQRRVIGVYSDQTNGDIDVRYSSAWPDTAITSLTFDSGNQLYVPNDDSLTGIRRMGYDKCFLYSNNSIHSLDYFKNYSQPFAIRTIVDGQGGAGHHSIVNLGDRHYLYNKNYGFCEFRGNEFPAGGRPISSDIEATLRDINTAYLDLIVGTYVPLTREVVWTVPLGTSYCDHLLFYNIDTGQWRKEDKEMSYIDNWPMYPNYTWNDLVAELGGAGAVWTDAGTNTWAYYTSQRNRLCYANTDGHLYYQFGENLNSSDLNGYRIEPAMHFNQPHRHKTLKELWFGLSEVGSFDLHVWYRGGDTLGELVAASWSSMSDLSCDSPSRAFIHCNKTDKFMQIKWGTDGADEKFGVNHIKFKYALGGRT